jgi:hypothetical protein
MIEHCKVLNDMTGSVSSCIYGNGMCGEYKAWGHGRLARVFNSLPNRRNLTDHKNQLKQQLRQRELDKVAANAPAKHFFRRRAAELRELGPADIYILRELKTEVIRNISANVNVTLNRLVDPSRVLSRLNGTTILRAIDDALSSYHRHIELRKKRQIVPDNDNDFPPSATLRGGETLYIEYQRHGNTKLQRHLFVIFVSSLTYFPRSNFDSEVFETRMQNLDAVEGDEKGHLIGSALGGSATLYNLLPQTFKLNRGNGEAGNWKTVENTIRQWLRADECHQVQFELDIDYILEESKRPYMFGQDVRYMRYDDTLSLFIEVFREIVVCSNDPGEVYCFYEQYN